jgi:hypothetical protein
LLTTSIAIFFLAFAECARAWRYGLIMDPLSITAGCVGIISGVASTSKLISQFVRRVRDAKSDLAATAARLSELEMTIGIIQDDFGEENDTASRVPDTILIQTRSVLGSCNKIIAELNELLAKYDSGRRRVPLNWALSGHGEVVALNRELEAHGRTLLRHAPRMRRSRNSRSAWKDYLGQ